VLFTKRCAKAGIEVSMGSVGDCYDNAVCETFHASLKKEKIYRQSWPTRAAARTAIFEYIEGWYNPRRRHSTLGYLSPIEFERQHTELARPDLPTAAAQAATEGKQGTNGNGWPLRPVVKEQAR
jgi:putative transposase